MGSTVNPSGRVVVSTLLSLVPEICERFDLIWQAPKCKMGDSGTEEQLPTIADDLVVTKYKMAAEIVNGVLKETMAKCVAGASVQELCCFADSKIVELTSAVYKKEKDMKKGISFPCCISVNNCICHFSPTTNNKQEDVDGFIAVVAHTVVVPGGDNKGDKIAEGRKADAILAAHYASEAALRLVKPGQETYTVTDTVQKIADSYNCKPIEGMLSHQLEQNIIDGRKTIIQNPTDAQRKEHEKYEFETHEVYAVDVLITSGEGHGREKDAKVSFYKKTGNTYLLKMKNSRDLYSKVTTKFGSMPFNLRSLDDLARAKMGVVECVNHEILEPFQVLYEREGEYVAEFKFTVLLMPNGPLKITGAVFDPETCTTENKIENEEILSLLKTSTKRKAAKKKKRAAEKAVADMGKAGAGVPDAVPIKAEQ